MGVLFVFYIKVTGLKCLQEDATMGVSGRSIIQRNCLGGEAWERGRGLVTGDITSPHSLPRVGRGLTLFLSPERGDGLEDAACKTGTHSWPGLHKGVLGFCSPGTAPGEVGGISGQQTWSSSRQGDLPLGTLQPCQPGLRVGHEPGAVAGTLPSWG